MKVLVSAACLAIIAFVGFFFWERYADASQERLATECREFQERNRSRAVGAPDVGDDATYDRCFDYFSRNPVDGTR